jgi:hypothetical protein
MAIVVKTVVPFQFSHGVVKVCTDILEKHTASIFKVVESDSGGRLSNLEKGMFQLHR